MKLIDYLLLSASVGLLIIGIYEVFMGNFQNNYWIFMLMLICLFVYGYRRNIRVEEERKKEVPSQTTTINKKKKKAKH